jgi:hypothetical protein
LRSAGGWPFIQYWFQNHAERASVKNRYDLAPALMVFATAPAAPGDFDIADSERAHEWMRWEKGADLNYLCITWIVTTESLETALLNKICQIQGAMLHGCRL